jgi:hypothetical protein
VNDDEEGLILRNEERLEGYTKSKACPGGIDSDSTSSIKAALKGLELPDHEKLWALGRQLFDTAAKDVSKHLARNVRPGKWTAYEKAYWRLFMSIKYNGMAREWVELPGAASDYAGNSLIRDFIIDMRPEFLDLAYEIVNAFSADEVPEDFLDLAERIRNWYRI